MTQAPEKNCNHQFWKDRNPANCFNCGKTEQELFDEEYVKRETATPPEKFKEVLEEFDKEFPIGIVGCAVRGSRGELKSFLISNLEKAREEGYEEGKRYLLKSMAFISSKYDKKIIKIRLEERQRVVEIVEGLKKESGIEFAPERVTGKYAYNLALERLISKLKE